ncbi:uncharacterized protein DNG_01850 [Cephalotrichum gorgonifer]|uniref:Uncharacterized protein n=1 Tax=Cephalotrichum gorgonifer TaxID=2041049 RepID=A0AAE8MSC3_9PEZI|nr:uncharacterized protein DNG_01850 [Cephalotrichum gorgonifer]
MPQTPTRRPRDSWPPTQVRINPSSIEDASLSSLEMPLTYFLSPTLPDSSTPLADHFLAGIEDAQKPKPALINSAASELIRRRKYGGRRGDSGASREPVPLLSEGSDSDEEDYVRFPPGGLEIRQCAEETRRTTAGKGKGMGSRKGSARNAPSTQYSRGRGRTPKRDGGEDVREEKSQGATPGRRTWREPSPYAWVIDEEEEDGEGGRVSRKGKGKEAGRKMSVRGRRSLAVSIAQDTPIDEKDVEVRLRRRKVRFVLPVKE